MPGDSNDSEMARSCDSPGENNGDGGGKKLQQGWCRGWVSYWFQCSGDGKGWETWQARSCDGLTVMGGT